MKYINRILVLVGFAALGFACEDEDTFPYDQDAIINNNGAFVRLDAIAGAEYDLLDLSTGVLSLESVDLTVEFIDNTPDNGDSSVPAVAVASFPASMWTRDATTGLPNLELSTTALTALDLLNLTAGDLDGGDVFRYEWTLNLTDGRSYNRNNQSSSLPAWDFYNSPFLADVSVVCLLESTFGTGSYVLSQQTDGLFGGVFEADLAIELVAVEGFTTRRQFSAVYLPQFSVGNGPDDVQFDLICGRVFGLAEQQSGLGCSGVNLTWGAADMPGSFDGLDDSLITLRLKENINSACGGGPVDVTWNLVKQ